MIDFTNFSTIATPKTIADIAFESKHDAQLMQSITSGSFGFPGGGTNGILLHGKYGAGKSTAATLIPDALEATSIGMNSHSRNMFRIMSNNNGVGLLNQIDNMCSFVSLSDDKYQYFILDEVDNLSAAAMPQLKSIMDSHMNRAVFIMTTNHRSKVDPAVVSRSHVFGFNKVPPDAWLPSMQRVLAAYGITNMSNSQLLSAAASINGSGRQFATCVKQLINGYYEMFPHLVPPHLLLPNVNSLPITVAQPKPVLPAIAPTLPSQIATPLSPTQATP
jgi:DNA polymerase III delta prime subunit